MNTADRSHRVSQACSQGEAFFDAIDGPVDWLAYLKMRAFTRLMIRKTRECKPRGITIAGPATIDTPKALELHSPGAVSSFLSSQEDSASREGGKAIRPMNAVQT